MSDKKYEDITLKRIKQLKGTDSQDAFAKKIKTTQSNVSKLLRGSPPSAATLKALAETYHVSVDWLLGLSDEMEIANKAHFHDLTADTLTYGDVMAVLEVLYEYLSVTEGYTQDGYNSELDPDTIIVRDGVLRYFLENRSRYSGGSRDIYDIWLCKAKERFGKMPLLKWTQAVQTLYDGNIPEQLSDEAVQKLVDDIANNRELRHSLEELTSPPDDFIDVPFH